MIHLFLHLFWWLFQWDFRWFTFFFTFFGDFSSDEFCNSLHSSPFLVTFLSPFLSLWYFPFFSPFLAIFYGHPVGSLRWRWVPSKTIQVVIFFSKIILNHHLLLLRSFLTFGTSSSLLQWMMTPNMPSRRPESWNFPLLRESANYTKDCLYQDSRAKEDSCEKNFPTHRQLTPGLLLMTCACQLKVVYGFEMMMTWESPCMLFEVIMNRFENDYSPDIIYDASCKLKEYALNREPKRFMSIRVTSDPFMKTITRLAHLVLKLLHIPPSAAQILKHVSNLIVSCAEFQARPPICSSPCSWEPLLCSSLTKISLPTKKR